MATPPGSVDADEAQACDSLGHVRQRLRAFRAERAWEQYHQPTNLAIAVSIEAGELLELFQWKSDEQVNESRDQDPDAFADELADVAICVVQLADALRIDLAEAIAKKIERNAERYPATLAYGNNRKHSALRAVGT